MPNRILREGILTSEKVCSLSWGAEVFFRRLMNVVDDFGRFYANPKLLRASCYPLQVDKVSDADVGKWLSESRKAALVSVYRVDGKEYVQLHNFNQQVRAKASKFPDQSGECVADAMHVLGDCYADAQHMHPYSDSETYPKTKASKRARGAPLTPLPDDFGISERVKAWAEENKHGRLEERLEYFRGYALANAKKYADWDQAFMNAIRGDWGNFNQSNGKANGNGAAPWWSSPAMIEAKGKELGVYAKPGETMQDYKGRVQVAIDRRTAA